MKTIKVLHIINTLGVGGAEANLLNLIRAMDSNRYECHVAYAGQGEFGEKFQAAGIRLFQFSKEPRKLKSLATFSIVWRLANYIRKNKIQILHTHTFNAHLWGVVAAKLTGIRLLEHVHDSRYMDPREFHRRGETSQQYRLIKWFRNLSDQVIVLTQHHFNFVIQNRIHRAERVVEIQNGIDLEAVPHLSSELREILRERFALNPHVKVVLTPIRFTPEKNLNVLSEILMDLVRQVPNVVCLVAGSGPEKEQFETKIQEAGMSERIQTIGFYSNIPELLNITDVFLLPSTIELHSIAILEAMRQKVPVVVSRDVGCNNEFIVEGQNGYLLDPFHAEGWAKTIRGLLENDSLRIQIGEAGFQTVAKRFRIQDIAQKIQTCYDQLAK